MGFLLRDEKDMPESCMEWLYCRTYNAASMSPEAGCMRYEDKKTTERSGRVILYSQPTMPNKLWYAVVHRFWAGDLSSLSVAVIASMGIPERYGVDSGVCDQYRSSKLLTRLRERPDWFIWTSTSPCEVRQEK